jgi:hypothetical protein
MAKENNDCFPGKGSNGIAMANLLLFLPIFLESSGAFDFAQVPVNT